MIALSYIIGGLIIGFANYYGLYKLIQHISNKKPGDYVWTHEQIKKKTHEWLPGLIIGGLFWPMMIVLWPCILISIFVYIFFNWAIDKLEDK